MSTILDKKNITTDPNAVLDKSRINPIISDDVLQIFQWITFTCLCQAIVIFGIGTNIINIICFVKQGFTDPVNVSLMGLAISDLCCLITLLWSNICLTSSFNSLDLPFDGPEFQYLTSAIPHVTFTRVTAWITALITLERCLCITVPLKVKNIVTPKRVAIIIVCVFVILLSSASPVYMVSRLDIKFSPQRNKTILGLLFTENREYVEKISFAVNNVAVLFLAFMIIIVCTAILVVKLHMNIRWRQTSTSTGHIDNTSNRNMKVAKMVVMISLLFIVCFVLVSSMFFVIAIEPQFSVDGSQRNTSIFFAGIGVILESINSSSNIFIYYHMSTKYRISFRGLFCANETKY